MLEDLLQRTHRKMATVFKKKFLMFSLNFYDLYNSDIPLCPTFIFRCELE